MSRFFGVSIFILVLALVSKQSHAQNSKQDYLNAHNAARATVGVPNLTWNVTVAAYAKTYANKRKGDCALEHSTNSPYGENLAIGGSPLFSGVDAVNMFVAEKADYNYSTNTCASGKVCGHYTQVVWRESTHLGCARVQCKSGWMFVVCSYDPPGNYDGEWPY